LFRINFALPISVLIKFSTGAYSTTKLNVKAINTISKYSHGAYSNTKLIRTNVKTFDTISKLRSLLNYEADLNTKKKILRASSILWLEWYPIVLVGLPVAHLSVVRVFHGQITLRFEWYLIVRVCLPVARAYRGQTTSK